eukprot:jgi/Chlat1/6859/Chrsp51S06539
MLATRSRWSWAGVRPARSRVLLLLAALCYLLVFTTTAVQAETQTLVRRFPSGVVNSCSVALTITSEENLWAYEVSLDNGPWTLGSHFIAISQAARLESEPDLKLGLGKKAVNWAKKASILPHSLEGLKAGDHTVQVRTLTPEGTLKPFATTWTVRKPTTTLVSMPTKRVAPGTDIQIEIGSDATKFACEISIDGAAWRRTAKTNFTESPRTVKSTIPAGIEGIHVARVRTVDDCGNVGTEKEFTWRTSFVDTIIVQEPTLLRTDAGVSLTLKLQADIPQYSFEFSVNGSAWTRGNNEVLMLPRTAELMLRNLPDGAYSLRVRAVDFRNRPDCTPITFDVTVDKTPPKTILVTSPQKVSAKTSAKFTWTCEDASLCTHEYRLDSQEWKQTDQSFVSLVGLPAGEHEFSVRSIDAVGNREPNEGVTYAWTIKLTQPSMEITDAPAKFTNSRTAKFSLTSSEDSCSFICSLDGAEGIPCNSTVVYNNLAEGAHNLRVHCVDTTGAIESAPARHLWTVDTIAPRTELHHGWLADAFGVRLAINILPGEGEPATESAYAFDYSLDGEPWSSITKLAKLGPGFELALANLTPGTHAVQARARDHAGNIDASPAELLFEVNRQGRVQVIQQQEGRAVIPRRSSR